MAVEANFDGLVGPTHHYGGLGYGNRASRTHGGLESNPKEAALQGLQKMSIVRDRKIPQGFLPPQVRPDVLWLEQVVGPGANLSALLEKANRLCPEKLAAAWSASSMWAANAATVSPSADTSDGKLHVTPANLSFQTHRSLEASFTFHCLQSLFADSERFTVHSPLKREWHDEGGANHMRLWTEAVDSTDGGLARGNPGLEVFVCAPGQTGSGFQGRQSRKSCEAIIAQHGLHPQRTLVAVQNPKAIAGGVFHNDVIAVSHQNFLLMHEEAYESLATFSETLRKRRPEGEVGLNWNRIQRQPGDGVGRDPDQIHLGIVTRVVTPSELSLEDSVTSYFFNSQLLSLAGGGMLMLCPAECRENSASRHLIEKILEEENPVREVRFLDLRQSMRNGGGPACLRLRVFLTQKEREALNPQFWVTPERQSRLSRWVEAHYRDRVRPEDLRDADFARECWKALEALDEKVLPGLYQNYGPYRETLQRFG